MKKILLLLMLILVTGCSATYDLYIGNNLTDDISILEDKERLKTIKEYNMEDDTIFNTDNLSYNIYSLESGFDYKRQEISNDTTSGYRYSYSYDMKNMNKKSMVYDCYDNISISKKSKILIETSDEFKCFDKYNLLDDVTINIHYDGDLYDTNADRYGGGIYTWNINKDNYKNKKIYLELYKTKRNYTFDIIGGCFLSVLIIVLLVIVKKFERKSY